MLPATGAVHYTKSRRNLRIKKKVVCGVNSIMDPLCIGFDDSLIRNPYERIRTKILTHIHAFTYVGEPTFDRVNVVINPILHDFHLATQNFLMTDNAALRVWMEEFIMRKCINSQFNRRGIYGKNNIKWGMHAAPRNLPVLCARLPNFNEISVVYGSCFVVPEASLSNLDVSQFSQTLQINASRAEPLTNLITSPYVSENFEDFRRILLAMCMPGQVQIDITYSDQGNNVLNGFTALCAKLLFSMSPGFQNISRLSALITDQEVGKMLTYLGYVQPRAAEPLNVESTRAQNAAAWRMIATNVETGDGWINSGCDPAYRIPEPLYNGINCLPIYGGLDHVINFQDDIDVSEIPPPPTASHLPADYGCIIAFSHEERCRRCAERITAYDT